MYYKSKKSQNDINYTFNEASMLLPLSSYTI